MSYRPICDVWILARPKLKPPHKYYGAYPAGFLSRARALIGVGPEEPVLHVCAGLVRETLYAGFGPNDRTLDLDPDTKPDYLMDARELGVESGALFPPPPQHDGQVAPIRRISERWPDSLLWPAILLDRPYTSADHEHYDVPADAFPSSLNDLLRRCLTCVEVGGRVGVLDYVWPSAGKLGKEVAVVAVGTGRNNRARWFTVWERLAQ